MNSNHYCVIMAGGVGSRFWPMSRKSNPKQFIDILGTGETLIQQTFQRLLKLCPKENIYIVTNDIYVSLVKEQLPMLSDDQILGEPSMRNTAPCIAYASHKIRKINPEGTIIVAPSDHIIMKQDVFTDVASSAMKAASEHDWLITLGIEPSRPDTGYGYIQFKETNDYPADDRMKKVKTFTEKPDHELAQTFLKSGDFLWNSGIFIWSVKSIIKALEEHLPEVESIFREGDPKYGTPEEKDFIQSAYSVTKNISIDYGIMEKAQNVYVLSSDFGWSDLGTWGSLFDQYKKDDNNNAVARKNVLLYDTKNSIINLPDGKIAVVQGLNDYIVVENDNALLICRKEDEQSIRQIVHDVKIEKGEKYI